MIRHAAMAIGVVLDSTLTRALPVAVYRPAVGVLMIRFQPEAAPTVTLSLLTALLSALELAAFTDAVVSDAPVSAATMREWVAPELLVA